MNNIYKLIGDPSWEHMPWKGYKSPIEQYKVLPSFVVIEWTYRIAAYACLWHAGKTNGLPVWFSAWMCGTCNDIAFMYLPFADNFWQAQASVMITPRLPLYIVEMYATIIYISTTAARQFNLPYVSEACLTGLLAHVLYGVYDINGPPNLWWTWHDGDAAISKRIHNAPIGSSMWILSYIGIHSLLLRWTETNYARLSDDLRTFLHLCLARLPQVFTTLAQKFRLEDILLKLRDLQSFFNHATHRYGSAAGWLLRIIFSGSVCTPMFMQLMGVFQILGVDQLGLPGKKTYSVALISYLALVARGFYKAHNSGALQLPKQQTTVDANKYLFGVVAAFYAVNVYLAATADSTKHTSTGVHQTFSDKSRIVKDVMGYNREDFIGPKGPQGPTKNDYVLAGAEEEGKLDAAGRPIIPPNANTHASEWYTVHGCERADRWGDFRAICAMAATGLVSYGLAFSTIGRLPSYIQ